MSAAILVPSLRFPEFEEKWKIGHVKDVANVTSGGTPLRQKNEYWGGDIPWVTTSLIDFNEITKVDEHITKEGLSNSSAKVFPVGTLLIALYGQGVTRGKVALLRINAATNQACAAIIFDDQIISTQYGFYELQRKYHKIRNFSNDGGQKNLSGGLIKSLSFSFPSFFEQQKIADFLTEMDKRIAQLEEKKRLLTEYKKGVMQKIFSQQIRFTDHDGTPYPDWEEKRLGDCVSKVGSGSTPKGGEAVYQTAGVPFIRSQNVKGNKLNITDVAYISEEINEKMKGSVVKVSDILLNITGASIGRSCVVPQGFEVGNVNQHVCIIRLNGNYTPAFFQAFLSSYEGQKAIMRTQVGGGREGLNFQGVRSLSLSVPCL